MKTQGLKFCLQAVTTLTEDDLEVITDAVANYKAAGMRVALAETRAVDDAIAQVTREREAIIALARAQYPDLFAPISKIDEAANQAATSPTNDLPAPTPAQKEAGNYKMGHLSLHGMDITIENPRGSERRAVDNSWVVPSMPAHYGYIKRTEGADGDHVDVFIGPTPESTSVWVINQKNPDGSFDEHKVMLGFTTAPEAKAAYMASFTDGWGEKVFESISAPMAIDSLNATLPRLQKAKPVKRASPPLENGGQIANRSEAPPAKNADLDAAALLADDDFKSALGDLGDIIGAKFRASLTPEQRQKLLPVMSRLFDAAFRKGLVEFRRAARAVLEALRAALGPAAADAITIDDLQAGYIMASQGKEGATAKRDVVSIETKEELEAPDVPDTNPDLERDSGNAATGDAPVVDPVQGDGSADGAVVPGIPAGSRRSGSEDNPGVPAGGAPASGERGDQPAPRGDGPAQSSFFAPGDSDSRGGGRPGGDGIQPDRETGGKPSDAAGRELAALEKAAAQRAAQSVTVIPGDLANIRESLPFLLPGQQEDVLKAETRFAKPDGYGFLFTNGTGTGKTFTGLGIVKRFERQGKKNILIVVPDQKIMADWVDSAKRLLLTVTPLQDTKDAGSGITITTYANLQDNDAVTSRNWDLIVPDESHTLMQAADGLETRALAKVRALSLHPDGAEARYQSLHAEEIARAESVVERLQDVVKRAREAKAAGAPTDALNAEADSLLARSNELNAALREKRRAVEADVKARQGAARPRLTFLSATPFAYVMTVDWANGFLFDYRDGYPYTETSRGYNDPDPHDHFFITHFGYRMRYNKLTKPDANVDSGLMERQFNTWLKQQGVLSGRMLEVDADYDRRFVLIESAIGNEIDRALEWVSDRRSDNPDDKGYALLSATVRERLFGKDGHRARRYLLEAIKAKEAIPIVREHLKLGRKVVVFHDFNKGGAVNPFDFPPMPMLPANAAMNGVPIPAETLASMNADRAAYNAAAKVFAENFPLLLNESMRDLASPIERFSREFSDLLLINGREPKGKLLARYAKFNDDAAGPLVALVQSDKNKGWSGHDTTGMHQRVLINLGLPTQPTKTLQTEGRIYRTGQVSNAVMRYLNTGTNWERWAFAETIASRAGTVENLANGEAARAMQEAFIAAFEESGDFPPGHDGEGTGGKARDRMVEGAITEFDRAISFYFGTQKKDARTKAREGKDYFATPEPLGLKMVEWADVRGGEDVLEPSAGHGAIARWFPDNTVRTAIEPELGLGSRMALVFGGKVVRSRFEDLHIVNKYDAIVMNPPFGVGGSDAIPHLKKAVEHLRDGGRIVALIPTGPAADKKFDAWFYEEQTRPAKRLMTHPTLGAIYAGDRIKTTNSFAQDGVVDGWQPGYLTVEMSTARVAVGEVLSVTPGKRTETYSPTEGLNLVASIQLPQVTFERAGTGVMTRIVIIDKGDAPGAINRNYADAEDIKAFFERIRDAEMPARKKGQAGEALPGSVPERAGQAAPAEVAYSGPETVVEHITQKGKILKGVVRNITRDEAQAIDPYTFKKDGGWFIRLKNIVEEPEATYAAREPGTLDLFGDEGLGPVDAGPQRDRVSRNVQPAGSVPGAAAPQEPAAAPAATQPAGYPDTPAPPGNYSVRTQVVVEVERTLPDRPIKTIEDAALATRYLHRNAVERFDAIVTDANGNPLAVVGSFKGARAQASVYPAVLLAEAVRVPGAANVWFSHNHPSGSAELSRADEILGATLTRFFDGSGIRAHAVLAVTPKAWAAEVYLPNGTSDYKTRGTFTLQDMPTKRVPVYELELRDPRDIENLDSIDSPTKAKVAAYDAYQAVGGPGAMLLDTQNRMVAVVPFEPMGRLKDTGGLAAIMRMASESNAASAVLFHRGEYDAKLENKQLSGNVGSNIGAGFERMEMRVLDIINVATDRAATEMGQDTARRDGVFSRGQPGMGSQIRDLNRVADRVRKKFPNAPQINVLPSSQYAPADLREFMAAEGMLNEADGVYWGGEVWVFANKIASPARAEWVMLHEFGHAGLRALFPMEIERRAKFATMLATNPDLQARVARLMEGRPEVQDMIDAVDEVLADAAASGERPSWLMEIVAWLRRHLRKLGLVNTYSDNDILSIVEMGRNRLRRGDRGSLAGAFSRAWHGTNARGIERFSTDFVGAGEGAQAFGWGLYFASKKDVANHYRKKLSDADSYDASFWKDIQLPDDLSVAEYRELNELRQILNDNGYRNGRALTPAESARWRTLMDKQVARASAVEAARPMGQLYEVEVPDDDILLLWDKPLNQQPPKVRAALESTFSEQERRRIAAWKRPAWALEPGDNPAAAYADVVNGSAIYNGMAAAMGSQEAASKALLAAGIKGIKYLDGGSRADGDGSYNYVIFSGDDVEIQRGLFSRIRYSRAGTGGPQARLQALAAAAAEIAAGADSAVARNVRPDLARYDGSPDVLLLWGDDRQGLQKIGARRGATVVADVLRAIARGKVERYTKANRTVVLAHRSARAVLRLERFGQRETWLLTGWEEGKPDESGEVRTQSGPTQRGPTFSRAELGAGLQTSLFPSRSEGNFSRAGTGQVAPAKLAPAGIIDTALRVPMQALGVDKLTRNAGRALTDMLAKFIPEKVKAGVVDDFGLGEVYVDRRALMYGQQRRGLREAKNLYNRIATVSREEAAVLYAAANNADASQVEAMIANLSPEGQAVLREVKQRVQDMGREQVRLGLLSAAAFERNEWAYLRRSYRKYEEAQTEKVRQRRGRAIQVWGDSYIGRGLFDSVDPSKLQGRGWFGTKSKDGQADKQAVGQKFVRLERRKPSGEGVDNLPGIEGKKPRGKLLEAVYWQVGEPIPSQYAEWENAGVWEARDTKGAKVVMWRDFTPDERKQMGEIDDFRYAMLKTMHFATHNVEVGRFLEWVADTQAVPDEDRLPPGAEVREANESLSVTYGRDVWVQVPSSKAGQSDARKYGKLAGQFVPGPIWNDLRQIVRTQHIQPFGELYADVLRFWKISKTALSPVVHMNNVVSNIVMADWHDVTAIDIIRGLRTYLRRDTDAAAKTAFEDFEDAGGTQGLYVLSEIQKDQLEPLLEALEAQLDEAGEARGQVGVLAALQFAMTGRLSDALSAATSSRPGKGVQKAGKLMMDMYEAEDTVFRFAAYLKAIEQGMTAQEAGKIARRSFLDYSINAPWIQLMRNTAFPFVSFVYRAIPMLWDVMQNKPWKLAKLALMIGAANALGYAMSGGDEERERALLPEELSGRVLGVVAPKLVRMPWNDQHGSPVYLDIRRWIPVGDIVDTGATNSAFPILPAMLPGGPLMMLGELLLNQSAFTGREITKESDTLAERGTKVADYLYKAFAPNLPGLPNTWSTESIAAAATGKTDIFGREVSSVGGAALGAIGIKARSYPTDTLAYQAQVRFGAQSREINAEIRSLARQAGRKGITAEEFEEGRLEQVEKLRELEAKLRERLERAAL